MDARHARRVLIKLRLPKALPRIYDRPRIAAGPNNPAPRTVLALHPTEKDPANCNKLGYSMNAPPARRLLIKPRMP